ncbi:MULTISPECIES: DUF1269 domain-containing protein [unclassified Nocardioides]|uniref:DUF1269 domain-containing protein n=1 Tax=unclassified Nocardioides TaxID=2615069 RepID=UPI00361CFB8F
MSLTVWEFATVAGAEDAEFKLKTLQSEELIRVHDAAALYWPADERKPSTRQLASIRCGGAMGGAFWGLLFGMLFFVPLLELTAGGAGGASSGALTDVGIDAEFVDAVRTSVTPGTSAIFVLAGDVELDRVEAALAGTGAALIRTRLSTDQESALRAVFAD